jgi:hypothetical protein
MASGTGSTTIDFGSAPGANETSAVVTGIAGIGGSAKVSAFVMGTDTSGSHTADDHKYFETLATLSCGAVSAGVGFTVYARSIHKLTGTWTVRYVWVD